LSVSYPTKLVLAFRSGNRCAFPNCDKRLTVDGSQSNPVVTGEAAHIAGEKPGAARFDGAMLDVDRDHYSNLIFLCGDHHTQIDKQEPEFAVERLLQLKLEHEGRVSEAIGDAFAEVGFAELEEATRWILEVPPNRGGSTFLLIPPADKLSKNDLTSTSRSIVAMGLSVAREVRSFVESVAQTDSDFPERLKAGFLSEYYRLRQHGHFGDTLFELMCQFAQRGFKKPAAQSAGLAVLVYLFEACEVFEK
jgi:hypothetical protein